MWALTDGLPFKLIHGFRRIARANQADHAYQITTKVMEEVRAQVRARRLVVADALASLEKANIPDKVAALAHLKRARARLKILTRTSSQIASRQPKLGPQSTTLRLLYHRRQHTRNRNAYLAVCALLDDTPACVWNAQINYPSPQLGSFVDVGDAYSHLPSKLDKVVSTTSTVMVVQTSSGNVTLHPYACIRDSTSGQITINFHLLQRFYPNLYTQVLPLLTPAKTFPPTPIIEVEPAGALAQTLNVARARLRLRQPTDPSTSYRLVRELELEDDATIHVLVGGELFKWVGNEMVSTDSVSLEDLFGEESSEEADR